MSFYIFHNEVPYIRKPNLLVVNRDTNHENDKTRKNDRLLMLSSRLTFEMSDGGRIRKVDSMAFSKFSRHVLLTNWKFETDDEFLVYYKNIISFIKNESYDSLEIPFIAEDRIDYKHYLKILLVYLSDFLAEAELNIGVYTSKESIIDNNLQLFDEFCVFVSNNNYEKIVDYDDFEFIDQDELLDLDGDFDLPLESNGIEHSRYNKFSTLKNKRAMFLKVEAPKALDSKKVHLDESFHEKLVKYLNKSKKSNVEIYTSGGISRQVFSQIISKKNMLPKKSTILCLIIGLELNLDDALDLLNAAGHTLSGSLMCDAIVREHIERADYSIIQINRDLDDNGEPIIGWNPR